MYFISCASNFYLFQVYIPILKPCKSFENLISTHMSLRENASLLAGGIYPLNVILIKTDKNETMPFG